MIKYLPVFIFILISPDLFSQHTITGNVTDISGNGLPAANVVIKAGTDAEIGAFAVTDSKGAFSIKINDTADSLIISVFVIDHESGEKSIANKTQQIQFVLKEKATELPSVTVKDDPVIAHGDTTEYSVSPFTGKQDRVIGDVLAKLPGIEVDESGGVKFNGKPISHYYIDGLDMLEGKYGIANKNIPADLVARVQVLEHHQDIKLYDSLKRSNETAVNIELKKKAHDRFIGKAQTGAGFLPLLYDHEITGLRFNAASQMISSVKMNNTGNPVSSEISDNNVSIQRQGDLSEKNIKEEIIPQIQSTVPDISVKRYLLNNSLLAHYNTLKLLKNKAQVKFNLSYLHNKITGESESVSSYLLPDALPVNFTEIISTSGITDLMDGNISYGINTKKIYLKNTIKVKIDLQNQRAGINNTIDIGERLKESFCKYSNEFLAHIPLKKKIISINSKINFNKLPQILNVMPGQFTGIINTGFPYERLKQQAGIQNFNTDNSLAFLEKLGKVSAEIKVGTEYINKRLQTSLRKDQNSLISNSFENDFRWNNIRLYGEGRTEFTKGKKQLELVLPVEFNILHTENILTGSGNNERHLFFNPSLNFSFRLSGHFSVETESAIQHSLGNIQQIISGYVLSDYRTISKSSGSIPLTALRLLSISFYYRNPLKALFGNLTVTRSSEKRNILNNMVYDNYFIFSDAVYVKNYSRSWVIDWKVSKYFIEKKLNLSLAAGANFSHSDVLQEHLPATGIIAAKTATVNINYSKWKFGSVQAGSRIRMMKNSIRTAIKNEGSVNFYSMCSTAKLFIYLNKTAVLCFNNEFYSVWDRTTVNKNYFFGDLGFTKKYKNTELQLDWTNYTNNSNYTSAYMADNFTRINMLKIRHANFTVKFCFNF